MGIPALEDGLFTNLLILDYFWVFKKSERSEGSERSERSTGPGRYLIFGFRKCHVECCQNHVWGPPGARVMSIFVKTYISAKDALVENHG